MRIEGEGLCAPVGRDRLQGYPHGRAVDMTVQGDPLKGVREDSSGLNGRDVLSVTGGVPGLNRCRD